MTMQKNHEQSNNDNNKIIFEMIDSSIELAEKIGKHPLTTGCNCISCVNKRKRVLRKENIRHFIL